MKIPKDELSELIEGAISVRKDNWRHGHRETRHGHRETFKFDYQGAPYLVTLDVHHEEGIDWEWLDDPVEVYPAKVVMVETWARA